MHTGEMRVDSFSEQCWDAAGPIWDAIKEHPFLMALESGTLPVESFRYYILQDYNYLAGFGRAAAAALSAAPDTETARRLLLRVSTPVERPLHGALFEALGATEREAESALPAPTNLAYQNHMEVSMRIGGLGVGIAAILPCPRIYHEVGKILGEPAGGHPAFGIWQASYSTGLLEASVRGWSELLDEIAESTGAAERSAMMDAYQTSARYEHMFWTMAYNKEEWPIT